MTTLRPLEEYDISAKTGFLPSEPPLRKLPNDYFAPWEDMMEDFNGLLLAGKLREKVHKVNKTINKQHNFNMQKQNRCLCLIIDD
jgi:indoleamine 2,3-dioxygenase